MALVMGAMCHACAVLVAPSRCGLVQMPSCSRASAGAGHRQPGHLPGYHSQQLALLCPTQRIAVAQTGDSVCPCSHRTSSGSPAISPRYGSADSCANSTEILRKRISGERKRRQTGLGADNTSVLSWICHVVHYSV